MVLRAAAQDHLNQWGFVRSLLFF